MNLHLVAKTLGLLLLLLMAAMLACLGYSLWDDEPAHVADKALGFSALLTGAAGGLLLFWGRRTAGELLRREAIAVVGLGWVASSFFGALPYMLTEPALAPAAAFFESASGFTTTGSSVMADVRAYTNGILLWRATTQWLGGMGILVLFVAVLSFLGAGSKSLFRNESSAQYGEGFKTRVHDTAVRLWQIYAGFTVLGIAGYIVLGMGAFDAVCHTFAAISTGGFSTRNESLSYYQSPAMEWWTVVLMILGGINFMLYAWALVRHFKHWKSDEETRAFFAILLAATLAIAGSLWLTGAATGFARPVREAAFQAVSVMTTTGFVSADFDRWPMFAQAVLVVLMFIGGCAGSTAGGIKVSRIVIFLKICARELIHSFRPRQVVTIQMNGRHLSEDDITGALFFLGLTGFVVAAGTLGVSLLEPDLSLLSSFTAVAATLFNIGPGLDAVGPVRNFGGLSAGTHLLLSFLMLLGRLEYFALLALFVPLLWRRY